MSPNVYQAHIEVKPNFASAAICRISPWQHNLHMAHNRKRPNYLRAWRKHRGRTLVQVAEQIHLSHGQLSRIERGDSPYNSDLLEALAELYQCEPVDMLIRDPSEPQSIWSIWDNAKPGEHRQIVDLALVVTKTGTDG
jgi:hypothetical protein